MPNSPSNTPFNQGVNGFLVTGLFTSPAMQYGVPNKRSFVTYTQSKTELVSFPFVCLFLSMWTICGLMIGSCGEWFGWLPSLLFIATIRYVLEGHLLKMLRGIMMLVLVVSILSHLQAMLDG